MMGLGDVSNSVIPKPVLVSAGDVARQHHLAVLHPQEVPCLACGHRGDRGRKRVRAPGTVASTEARLPGIHSLVVLHPAGQIDVEVELAGQGGRCRRCKGRRWYVPPARSCRAKSICPTTCSPDPRCSEREPSAGHVSRQQAALDAIIVPTRAGGGNDTMARIIAARLGPLLGQQVLVDNRAGANGAIACEYVAGAEPDGHTLLFGYIGTHAMNPALQKVGYDPVQRLRAGRAGRIVPDADGGASAEGSADVPTPRRSPAGSAGTLSAMHRPATERRHTSPRSCFNSARGTSMSNATHDGAAPAIADTIDGRSQVMFPSLFTAHPFILDGKLRALAVAGPARLDALPEVPTLSESGIEGVDVAQWYGLFAPARTSPAVIAQINRALERGSRQSASGCPIRAPRRHGSRPVRPLHCESAFGTSSVVGRTWWPREASLRKTSACWRRIDRPKSPRPGTRCRTNLRHVAANSTAGVAEAQAILVRPLETVAMSTSLITFAALAASGAASAQSSVTLFGVADSAISHYSVKSSF